MSTQRFSVISLLVGVSVFYGCGQGNQDGPPDMGAFPVNVVAARAVQETIEDRIVLVGSLEADEAVDISPEVAGFISSINFREGQSVEQGDVLFELENAKQRARLEEAQAAFSLAEINLERNRNLFESKTIARQDFDRAQSDFDAAQAVISLRQTELEDTFVRASFDGVVGARNVSPGQYVQAGTALASLVRTNPVKADFNIPERFLRVIAVGQPIRINVAAYPGEDFAGEVYFVSPTVNAVSRTVRVRAELPNDDERLKPGMFGQLALVVAVKDNAITIPEAAIMQRGDSQSVAIVDDERKIDFRTVRTGLRLDGKVEVVEGLEPGEIVVVEGHQKVGPGSNAVLFSDARGTPFEGEEPATDGPETVVSQSVETPVEGE